jgi:hypothetical protein
MPDAIPTMGPPGPFPRIQPSDHLTDHLDRRWLHYAFRSPDGCLSMIANLSSLGTSGRADEHRQRMSVLLLHERGRGWRSTQFNATVDGEPWSAFRLPHPGPRLRLAGRCGTPAVDLRLTRTGRACTSQCAPFATGHHLRWQSEPGVVARGSVRLDDVQHEDVHLVGYHERVRGQWGWPELGGWVFGFANDRAAAGRPPAYSVVFTLIQPPAPADATAGSVMLWRRGRLLRHFPRRRLDVAVVGLLGRDQVEVAPPLAAVLGTPCAAPVPARLVITASMGQDRLLIDIVAETAGRIVNPSETSLLPFGVHEVLGPCRVSGSVSGHEVAFTAGAVVEFAGGAHAD